MARIICMANSRRPHGRCVAGIDLETGQWVRPVLKGQSAIPDDCTLFGQRRLAPLDVIECELAAPHMTTEFQRENCLITSKHWRIVDTVTSKDVLKYCSNGSTVLHSRHKVVDPDVLKAMKPEQWSSLELRRLPRVTFTPDPRKPRHWQANFHLGSAFGSDYTLSLTDPVAEDRLNAGDKLDGEWLMTISLTEPIAFPQFNKPDLCYKLAAAVIPI